MSWLEKWEVRESGLRERERGRREREVGHSGREGEKNREKKREKWRFLGEKFKERRERSESKLKSS